MPLLPFSRAHGSLFTAADGSYYGLAQLTGADPSLFGCADQIEVTNDPADGSLVFYLKTTGGDSPGVLQLYNGTYSIAYDIGVVFDGPFTALAELWIGYGVGGGNYVYENVRMENPTELEPTLRLTGTTKATFGAFGPTGSGQRFGGVLLCTGADVDVTKTWNHLTIVSDLDGSSVVVP